MTSGTEKQRRIAVLDSTQQTLAKQRSGLLPFAPIGLAALPDRRQRAWLGAALVAGVAGSGMSPPSFNPFSATSRSA
jgi:hypothetical protein